MGYNRFTRLRDVPSSYEGMKGKQLVVEVTEKGLTFRRRAYMCVVAQEGGDYSSIQDALNAGEKNIFVAAGTYEITSPITILSSGVTIKGENWKNTIIKVKDGANCHAIQIGNGSTTISDITIEDITIDGNRANQTADVYGIYFYGDEYVPIYNCLIHHCQIKNVKYIGIFSRYLNKSRIVGNVFTLDTNAIYLMHGYDIIISENWLSTIDNIGIGTSGDERIIVHSNTLMGISYAGILLGQLSRSVASNNFITSSEIGILVNGSSFCIVEGNIVYGNTSQGIYLSSSNDNTVFGNQSNSNQRNGIYLDSSSYNTVIGNRCQGNSYYGINIPTSASNQNLVVKNYLTGNTSGPLYDAGTGTIKAASTTNDNVV